MFKALAKRGLKVSREGSVYTVGLPSSAVQAEILLPAELPLEEKAVRQLANLAAVHHPDGGAVCRACATPDFHPGDAGVAIGSVVESKDFIIPGAVGKDINCGMRFHTTDLDVNQFMALKPALVELLKGDYLLGTRDVVQGAPAQFAMFKNGIPHWAEEQKIRPLGRMGLVDWDQVKREATEDAFFDPMGRPFPRVYSQGSLFGNAGWVPDALSLDDPDALYRDEGLATIGRGNHFVEIQVVEEVLDRKLGYQWGVREGQVSFMIHSGSRNVGRYIGSRWEHRAREAWPAGVKYPETGIFPISCSDELFDQYLAAQATAANYGFVNRALLAELCRLRLREVFGDLEAPLVYDLPHNLTLPENGKWVTRKGACPAHSGQPVIIPGSMGASSYLCVGLGNDRWMSSASHGAGRSSSRGSMGRFVKNDEHARELGLEGVECITLREERRVEEAPAAYKPIQPVIDSQVEAGMIKVVAKMSPILTFKA